MNNNMFTNFPDVLTIEQLQEALVIGKSTAYRLIKSNQIKHLRIGKNIRVPKQYLVEYLAKGCYNSDSNGNLTCQPKGGF